MRDATLNGGATMQMLLFARRRGASIEWQTDGFKVYAEDGCLVAHAESDAEAVARLKEAYEEIVANLNRNMN